MSRSAALLLCLLGCHVWKAVTKTLRDPGAGAQDEVTGLSEMGCSVKRKRNDNCKDIYAVARRILGYGMVEWNIF
ncbi:family with sequence similarity 171 member A1 [Phyllostomus discolor]|uniref:Family with sequence similarity 171 member A1 n=1 Tax=Phyllostomus discolor TaxID=89673 RepID=A0A834BFQ2_9CHIR|nr:family with sequence similarity 171 member A1 [Phyllostomus discolor]